MLQKIYTKLNQSQSAVQLLLFRFLFGGIMLYEMYSYWTIPFIDELIVKSKINFRFQGLGFLPVGSEAVLKLILFVATISTIFIAIGKFFRIACMVFLACYAYLFLLDETYFNNHIYLIINVTFLCCFATPHFVKNQQKKQTSQIAYWQLLTLQLVFCLPYFYGGLGKLNLDWINGAVTQKWLQTHGSFFSQPWVNLCFAWGGLVFDLCIAFVLFIAKTRLIGVSLAIAFNITNAILFDDISIFPYLMIASLVLFIKPTFLEKNLASFIRFLNSIATKNNTGLPVFPKMLVAFFVFHLLFPLRCYLFAGNADWTGKAQYFSWHMKSNHRHVENVTFYLTHPNHPEKIRVPVEEYLVYEQFYVMGYKPEMMVEFAKFIKADLLKKGISEPKITLSSRISFNGRPYQAIIDSSTDLTTINPTLLKPFDWVLPLQSHK